MTSSADLPTRENNPPQQSEENEVTERPICRPLSPDSLEANYARGKFRSRVRGPLHSHDHWFALDGEPYQVIVTVGKVPQTPNGAPFKKKGWFSFLGGK